MPSSAIHVLIITTTSINIPPLKLIDTSFAPSVESELLCLINRLKLNEKLIVTQESNTIIKTKMEDTQY